MTELSSTIPAAPNDAPAGSQDSVGYRAAEQRRLERQAGQLSGEAAWLLDRVAPLYRGRVVELGHGARGYLDALSERAGSHGTVVGVEPGFDAVALARLLVARRGLGNVELVHGDLRSTGLAAASFDLATARLVLVNVPRPEEIVAESVGLTRPGGTVAFLEADAVTGVSDPPLDAWTRLRDLLNGYARLHDIDPLVGRRLPRLLSGAGLVDVQTRPIIHIGKPGHPRHSLLPDLGEDLKERLPTRGSQSRSGHAERPPIAGPVPRCDTSPITWTWPGRRPEPLPSPSPRAGVVGRRLHLSSCSLGRQLARAYVDTMGRHTGHRGALRWGRNPLDRRRLRGGRGRAPDGSHERLLVGPSRPRSPSRHWGCWQPSCSGSGAAPAPEGEPAVAHAD